LITRAVRRLKQRAIREMKRGHPCAIVFTNQMRTKIGVQFGDPECLHGDSLINFVDGRSVAIRDVVEKKMKGPVWSLNESTGKIEKSIISGHYVKGIAGDRDFYTVWAEGIGTKNGVLSATATKNHYFLTINGWKKLKDIVVGEKVITKYQSVISGTLKDFLLGTSCGDSTYHRTKGQKNACLKFQDSKNSEYMRWKGILISPFLGGRFINERTFRTAYSYELAKFSERFDAVRSPIPLLRNFSWLGFAIWIMDDGHYSRKRYTLSVGRFKLDKNMQDIISEALNSLHLFHKWSGKNILFRTKESFFIAKKIARYVPSSMQYKLPEGLCGEGDDFELKAETPNLKTEYVSIKLVDSAKPRKYRSRKLYDITVQGNNNYFVGNLDNGVVVHNSMPGGFGMKHEFSLLFRCVRKSMGGESDTKKYVDKSRRVNMAQRHSFAIRKEKVLTLAGVGEFVRVRESMPELGLVKGMVDDYITVMNYAKEYGVVFKEGSKWRSIGIRSQTLKGIEDYWKKNPSQYWRVQMVIVEKAKERLVNVGKKK